MPRPARLAPWVATCKPGPKGPPVYRRSRRRSRRPRARWATTAARAVAGVESSEGATTEKSTTRDAKATREQPEETLLRYLASASPAHFEPLLSDDDAARGVDASIAAWDELSSHDAPPPWAAGWVPPRYVRGGGADAEEGNHKYESAAQLSAYLDLHHGGAGALDGPALRRRRCPARCRRRCRRRCPARTC